MRTLTFGMFNVLNLVAYQAVWFACVAGAAHDLPWVGALAAALALGMHFALVDRWQLDLQLIGVAVLIGFVLDSTLAATGLLEFTSGVWVHGLTTYWMLCLWIAFATTLRHSLRWLVNRPLLAAAAGALGGPLAYYAGASLGALRLPALISALPAIGALWGGALWTLATATRRFALRTAPCIVLAVPALSACQMSPAPTAITTAEHVDVGRFMGSWYVIASIPTFIERDAYNAVETYRRDDDGTIDTVFTFNKGAFDGPLKRYTPRGFVRDESGAVWGMQFLWPIKADYRIVYVSEDYTRTIVGRQARDHVWIMAREPSLSSDEYASLLATVTREGYDVSKLRLVPQQTDRAEHAHQ
jgi:apolipoprotein D and lipocalin family protein